MAILRYNLWNFEAEPGDIMVAPNGRAWRLYERRGSQSAAAGELCMRELKKPGMRATIQNDELVWIKK